MKLWIWNFWVDFSLKNFYQKIRLREMSYFCSGIWDFDVLILLDFCGICDDLDEWFLVWIPVRNIGDFLIFVSSSLKYLIFLGFMGFLDGRLVIFDVVEMVKSVDFVGFARSGCRTRKSKFLAKYGYWTDRAFWLSRFLLDNVNLAGVMVYNWMIIHMIIL